jgi:nucleolar complex protein 3
MLRSVEALFDSDVSGDTTLEIVKLISLIVKKRGRKVREEMLLCLLRLRFDEEQGRGSAMVERGGAPVEERKSEREREREREKEKARALEANRKHKKKWKRMSKEETRELQRDLAEGEGEVRPEYKKIVFTAVVSELFTIYFRYLKDEPNARVLPVVLQGLAKFSHLVNIELVLDMLEFLKELMTTNISTDSKLNCVLAAFRTLRTHADAITIDLKDFFACLFALLWDFADPAHAASIPALFTCLELMFNSRYNVPLERVASFVKRLCVIAASMTPSCALGVLHQVRLILRTYPTATKLLDIESSASGAFLAEVDDPDVCNAFATTAWEVAALTMSYHPFLRDYAQSLLAEEQTELVRVPARTLLLHYDASHGEFNPPLKPPGALSNKALKKMRLMRKLRARSGLESDFVQQLRERLSPPRA